MKSLLSTCAAFALTGALFAPAALAQQTVVTPQQQRAGLPSGPYLLSCTRPHVVNGSLVALCDDQATARQGMDAWHTAQMSLAQAQQCNGAIEDVNGRLTCGTAPMVGSSMPPQNYGSSFGTSGPTQGYSGAPANNPNTLPYATGAPGYPGGQPVPPANKPYYSPSATGSSMMPQNYGSSYGTSIAPYDRYGTGAQGQLQTPPNPDYGSSYGASGAPYDRYTTRAPGQPRTPPNPD
jgi:hypothetical protein